MPDTALSASIVAYLSAVPWSHALTAFVGAGFGSALVQGGMTTWREHKERGRSATYMAMRLSVIMEGFAAECADLLQQNRNAQHYPDQEYPEWDLTMPTLGAFPDDDSGWRHLDQKLASRCLSLPNKIAGSKALLRDIAEYVDDELGDRFEMETASRALEAWRLACELRASRHLPHADLVWEFNSELERGARSMDVRKQELKEKIRQRALAKAERSAPS